LGTEYQFEFVDGAYPWPMAAGIREAFGEQICFSYYDGSADSALAGAQDLLTYVIDNGPFDAVMGFSLGATLAATLLLRDAQEENQSIVNADADQPRSLIFRCAIFLCGTLPCDWKELAQGNMRFLHATDIKQPIPIPTVHVWSAADNGYPGQSKELVEMCVSQGRSVLLHNEGHAVPSQRESIHSISNAIREMVSHLDV